MTDSRVGKGRCRCGSITMPAKAMSNEVSACHCGMCRRWTGGPLSAVDCGTDVAFGGEERRFQLEQSATEFCTSHSGLALVGLAINRYTSLKETLRGIVKRHGIPTIELIRAYLGQLCLGKSDFDAPENMRDDRYFKQVLGIKQMPSAA